MWITNCFRSVRREGGQRAHGKAKQNKQNKNTGMVVVVFAFSPECHTVCIVVWLAFVHHRCELVPRISSLVIIDTAGQMIIGSSSTKETIGQRGLRAASQKKNS